MIRLNSRLRKPVAAPIRVGQLVGKYRIEKRLGLGGFAIVFRALDTIEGVRVAVKIPYPHLVNEELLESFRQEVRLVARMDHRHILGVKDASFIDGHFVIATLMGEETLNERLTRRLAADTALDWSGQLLDAVAYAHHRRIVHCDIKPENVLIFPDNLVRLTDFGIAKISTRTIVANGTGTVGYMAPEQAMGRPSARSDVFSLGLLMYRMLSGSWPEWPFDWPPPGMASLRRKGIHPDLISLLRRALQVRESGRFRDAGVMLREFRSVEPAARRNLERRRRSRMMT